MNSVHVSLSSRCSFGRGGIATLEAVSRANVILQQNKQFEKNFLIKILANKHLKKKRKKENPANTKEIKLHNKKNLSRKVHFQSNIFLSIQKKLLANHLE